MSDWRELRAALEGIEVVDAHEHHRGGGDAVPLTAVVPFLCDNYLWGVLPFHVRDAQARIRGAGDDRAQYAALAAYWPGIRNTAHARIVDATLERLGVPGGVRPENYEAILALLGRRDGPRLSALLRERGIRHTLTNIVGHGCFGGLDSIDRFAQGELTFEAGIRSNVGVEPLIQFESRGELERLAAVAGGSAATLGGLEACAAALVARCAARGAAGLKVSLAYTTGLMIGNPSRAEAEAALQSLLRGETPKAPLALTHYLLNRLVGQAGDLGLPVAFHTGYLQSAAADRTNVRHLAELFTRFPHTDFDVYHLSYPYFDSMLEAAKSFPNLYCNCCWTQAIDPAYTQRFLRNAIGTIPASHLFAFGGDYAWYPEYVPANLDHTKNVVGAALAEAMSAGYFGRDDALELGRWWLYSAPKALYRL